MGAVLFGGGRAAPSSIRTKHPPPARFYNLRPFKHAFEIRNLLSAAVPGKPKVVYVSLCLMACASDVNNPSDLHIAQYMQTLPPV